MLRKNQAAPDFTLRSTSGQNFTLSIDAKQKPIIIYFYPRDNTRVCTQEACQFRDNFEILKNLNIDIVGISTDSISKHQAFKEKHDLPFELLSDDEGKVSKLYKAYIPFLNISKRITYLLDAEHKIVTSFQDLFSAERHIKNVIDNLENIKQ